MLIRSGSFDRVYLIYLYVDKPQDIFVLRPKIADEVFQRWDEERAKLNRNNHKQSNHYECIIMSDKKEKLRC